jgi:hypothetical protein
VFPLFGHGERMIDGTFNGMTKGEDRMDEDVSEYED